MIPDDVIASIRERVDIKVLVEEYTRLKKSGVSWKGLCPFHNEKTPSFYVHPQRRFFHCFGCKASGDVFKFLMDIEGLRFREAAVRLAERAGVEIPSEDPERDAVDRRRRLREARLYDLVESAAGFFVSQLQQHPLGVMAEDAWRGRRLTDDTARSFRLGYAPDGWDGLVRHLANGGWSPADAEKVGLIAPRRNGRGYYDRFRHRLMFPIADHQGRIVAFSGRLLEDPPGKESPPGREPGAKYINSPEGPLYTKGKILFGLHEGRVAARRTGELLLCEGNFDLLALHQAGFANSVAPMGTALTADQAKLLKRFAERVVLLFDGDKAGRRAVAAAFPVLAGAGLAARVVTLPQGSDPDSFLQEHGTEALTERVESAPGIVDFLINDAAQDAYEPAAKAAAVASLGPVLVKIDNPVERRLYVERVAQKFDIRDIEAVRQQLRRGVREGRGRPRRNSAKNAASSGAVAGNRPSPSAAKRRPQAKPFRPPGLAGELLGALLDQPELFRTPEAEKFGELLTRPDLRAIFQTASRMVESRGGVEAPSLLDEVRGNVPENPALPWLKGRLALQEYDDESARAVLRDGVWRLEIEEAEQRARRLRERILEAYREGDHSLATELTRERDALLRGVQKRTAD